MLSAALVLYFQPALGVRILQPLGALRHTLWAAPVARRDRLQGHTEMSWAFAPLSKPESSQRPQVLLHRNWPTKDPRAGRCTEDKAQGTGRSASLKPCLERRVETVQMPATVARVTQQHFLGLVALFAQMAGCVHDVRFHLIVASRLQCAVAASVSRARQTSACLMRRATAAR